MGSGRSHQFDQTQLGSLEILQEPLQIVELDLRPRGVAQTAAEFLEDAASALHVDLARHLHRSVVAVIAAAQGPTQRIGLLLGPRRSETSRTAGARAHPGLALLLPLHRLG